VHVVVQTHWDREWYLSRQATLARAAAVLEQVLQQLEDGSLSSFLFDGQTAAFEDLLAVAEPALAQRLLAQAAAGRLVLGPWYVMADEFLVSGESLLRNLELGLADALRRCPTGAQRVGYLPDSFGHVSQMPQLLAQFGIHSAVLWRGADARHNVFDWQAPDGSCVGTVFLTEGYYQHPLNLPRWREALVELLVKLEARTPDGPLLLTQGGDHLMPAPEMAARMAEFNAEFNAGKHRWQLVPTTLQAHVEQALAASAEATPRQRIAGELRHNRQAFVLPDVLSTRRYLKLMHQQAEDRLLGETEPLWACLLPHGASTPRLALQRAWRCLIEQQAHDSLCGCSIDEVHAEMAQRFVQLQQQLDGLHQQLLAAVGAITLCSHDASGLSVWADDSLGTLFNPLPQKRKGWWLLSVFLQGERHQGLTVKLASDAPSAAEAEHELPAVLLSSQPAAELISPLDDFPERLSGHRYELAVELELPGLGSVGLRVDGAEFHPPTEATEAMPISALDNGAWRVELSPSGQLLLHDKRSPHGAQPAFDLLSELDAGDSYNFSPPLSQHLSQGSRWTLIEGRRIGALQEWRLALCLALPAGLDEQREGRSANEVQHKFELRLRLLGDEPHLHAALHWHNRASDQRTRLLLALPPGDADPVHSDTAFDWVQRSAPVAQIPATATRAETPVAVMPSLSAIAAGPWSLAHRGLQEFEIVQHEGCRWLGLTLVRCVGWLSRRDLRTRGVGAGPDIATPGAQCEGPQQAEFWLIAQGAAPSASHALEAAGGLRRPPVWCRGRASAQVATVDIGNPVVQTSSVRRDEQGRLELRLWNPSHEAQTLRLDRSRWQAIRADGVLLDASVQRIAPHAMLSLRERSQEIEAAPLSSIPAADGRREAASLGPA